MMNGILPGQTGMKGKSINFCFGNRQLLHDLDNDLERDLEHSFECLTTNTVFIFVAFSWGIESTPLRY